MAKFPWPMAGEAATAADVFSGAASAFLPGVARYSVEGKRDAVLAELISGAAPTSTSTLSALTFFTGGATKEQAITQAIALAVSLGMLYVFVPQSMLPFTASLVTFNTAVQMIREGGSGVAPFGNGVDVLAYGASANNVADDSAAVQAAINRAQVILTGQDPGSGVFVVFPSGTYLIKTALSITRYVTLVGNSYEGTVLNFNLTVPGVCINWNNAVLRVRFGFGCRELSFAGQSAADGQTLFQLTNCMGIVFSRCMFGGVGAGGGVQTAFGTLTQTSYPMWEHCFWSNCATCFSDSGATGSTENIIFQHCAFSQNVSQAVGAFGVVLFQTTADYHFIGCSFDSVRLVIQSGTVSTVACHFEDPNNQLSGTSLVQAQSGGGDWTSTGDYFLTRSTTNAIINWGFGRATINGRWTAVGVNPSCPALVNLSGAASCYVDSSGGGLQSNVGAVFANTSTGLAGVLAPPEAVSADRGDASVTVVPMTDYPVQLFNTPLTANRTVTLNTALQAWGATFRVIRGAGATGNFSLTVGPRVLNEPGQWTEVALQQNGTWIETASGNVGPNIFGDQVITNTRFEDVAVGLTWGASVSVNAAAGDKFVLTATSNIAATIAAPTGAPSSPFTQLITFEIVNSSGGALTTPVAFAAGAGAYRSSGGVSPGNGLMIAVTYRWSSGLNAWVEIARGAAV